MAFIRFACWIPGLLWIGLDVYVNRFEGWGQWAAAPILLIPLLASAVFILIGLTVVWSRYRRQRSISKIDALATFVSGLPVMILVLEKLL